MICLIFVKLIVSRNYLAICLYLSRYQLSRIDLNDRIKVEKVKKELKRTEEKWKKVKELELKDRKIKEENSAKSALAQKHQMEKFVASYILI